MPYPIPDNLDDIEGWRWYLVPLPDSDPMIRIAWGMWSELTNYWMWGEEGPVPDDSDKAAQLWSEALYEAWRVRDMGFPDDILTYIDDIETLLTALNDSSGCCDDAIYEIVTDPDGVVQPLPDDTGQDIVWDDGTPPGGESTWEDATLERCKQAETFAAGLHNWIQYVQIMHSLPTLGLLVVLSYFLAGMASVGLAVAVTGGAFGVAGAYVLIDGLRDLFALNPDYEAAEAELQSAVVIDAIVCAIIQAGTAEAAESAIDSALAGSAPNAAPMIELLPLRWMMGRIFNLDGDAGSFGGPCRDCAADGSYTYTYPSGTEGWVNDNRFLWSDPDDAMLLAAKSTQGNTLGYLTSTQYRSDMALPGIQDYSFAGGEFTLSDYPLDTGWEGTPKVVQFVVRYADGTETVTEVDTNGTHQITFTAGKVLSSNNGAGTSPFKIICNHNGDGTDKYPLIDDVTLSVNEA